jgi:hypothetical protein
LIQENPRLAGSYWHGQAAAHPARRVLEAIFKTEAVAVVRVVVMLVAAVTTLVVASDTIFTAFLFLPPLCAGTTAHLLFDTGPVFQSPIVAACGCSELVVGFAARYYSLSDILLWMTEDIFYLRREAILVCHHDGL